MYKRFSLLKEPENSRQKLWRYLKCERLLEIIDEDILYFPHITKMPDKWEGLLTEKTKNKLFKEEYLKYKNAETARAATLAYERFKEAFYINCWHMNDYESYLMWKVYGDRGCAIQTNYERLVASFGNEPPEINGCAIEYIDYERDYFAIGNTFYSVSYKDLPYKDEKEFRLLYWKTSLVNQNYQVDEYGVKVKIDAKILIDNIFINPSRDINLEKLKESIKNKGIDCEVIHSKIRE